MGTRWKNSLEGGKDRQGKKQMGDRWTVFCSECKKAGLGRKSLARGIVAAALAVLALVILLDVITDRFSTAEVWMLGIVVNAGLGQAVLFFVRAGLMYHYRNWLKDTDVSGEAVDLEETGVSEDGAVLADAYAYYQQWRAEWRQQQKVVAAVFGVLAALVLGICFTGAQDPYLIWASDWHENYAHLYLLAATVTVQCALAELAVIRFMLRWLGQYMACAEDVQRRQIEGVEASCRRRLEEMEASCQRRLAETEAACRQQWEEREAALQREMDEALERALALERESRERISRSDRLRMDLITNVSHDLKTPLTSMVGYLELLKKEEMTDAARDYLEVIAARAGKLKEMIGSLFSLAKVSSGNVELKREEMDMNRLIEQVAADMEDRIRASELEIVYALSETHTAFTADSGYMYRVCQNLIDNALKYAAKGTRVFVKTYQRENGGQDGRGGQEAQGASGVCLEITNTAGYPMDFAKEDIVERFARGDGSRTTEGNGLGLAIVSTYVKAMGGEFDIAIDCDQFKAAVMFEI